MRVWREVGLLGQSIPADAIWVGGKWPMLYFVTSSRGDGDKAELLLWNIGQNLELVGEVPSKHLVFVDEVTGYTVGDIPGQFTVDKGNSWHPLPPESSSHFESLVDWDAVAGNLIISHRKTGKVSLLKCEGNNIRQIWTADLGERIHLLTVDEQNRLFWCYTRYLIPLDIASGKTVQSRVVELDMPIDGFQYINDKLIAWSFDNVLIVPDPHEPSKRVSSVLPGTKHIFLLSDDNKGLVLFAFDWSGSAHQIKYLNGEIGSEEVSLNVDRLVVPVEVDPNYASKAQMSRMWTLSRKVPKEVRSRIFEESNRRSDMTPKERVQQAIHEFEKFLESQSD